MSSSLSLSPHFTSTPKPLLSSTSSTKAYILFIAPLPSHYAAASSSPSNKIDIFDKYTLKCIRTLAGHEDSITGLRSVDRIGDAMRMSPVSSGKDGKVVIWDDRASNEYAIKLSNMGAAQPLLCFDVSHDGNTVAAGTDLKGEDAVIYYWDPRRPDTPIREHNSTHSDDITTLSFSPSSSSSSPLLLSGSSDGLICISNPYEDDPDESTLHVANWGCSIAQAGWVPETHQTRSSRNHQPRIWAASDMETFSTLSHDLDPLLNIDIRAPSVHSEGWTWVTDYLITCLPSSSSTLPSSVDSPPNLGVFVGSNEGDLALLSHTDLVEPDHTWNMHKQWTNGHAGIVRSLFWDEEHNVLVTGGEDTRINVWSEGTGVASGSKRRDMDWEPDEHSGKRARR
ncbi:hypothetical protein AMATHDRAFT_47975 [Amanita thiersii Skay4041]|uniref:WD40 repeat-like protein n=1 Tax=Amanita thiersii Skay4041 TaxID=703135 RepID=A0A2A9NRL1_9AGAR|nr:hypothetical protein AMATHDRAFT_47975 [Amanita thiersii Skay4041]